MKKSVTVHLLLFIMLGLINFDNFAMHSQRPIRKFLNLSRINKIKKRHKPNGLTPYYTNQMSFIKTSKWNNIPKHSELFRLKKLKKASYFKNDNFYSPNQIAIIGLGHMGKAIAKGLIGLGKESNISLILSSKSRPYENIFFDKPNVSIAHNNREAVENADIVILAVKPLMLKSILTEIADLLNDKIVISVVAGVSIKLISQMLGNNEQKIIRIMTNLPVECKSGLIGIFTNKLVTTPEKSEIVNIFGALGKVIELENEDQLDIITVLVGCGPALVSYLMQNFIETSSKLGLSDEQSRALMIKTFAGTCNLLERTHIAPNNLIAATATKGGVTEQIIKDFNSFELDQIIKISLQRGLHKLKSLDELVKSQL